MEISKRYNSAPVKDNCVLFHLPPIFGPGLSNGVILISPLPTTVAMATNFGTKLTTNRPAWKIIAPSLPLPRYFWACAIQLCHSNFFLANPCCYGSEFWDKTDYNSAPAKDNCTLFSPTPYFRARAVQWCHVNFSPEDPVVMATNRFYSKTKLAAVSQERQTLKRIGYKAWQWPKKLKCQTT